MAIIDFSKKLSSNTIYCGDSRVLLRSIEPESIALSIWSPPYYVGKDYEKDLTFNAWKALLRDVIKYHFPILKPGGFLVINIADILCFKDELMPKIMAENVSRRKVELSKEEILKV
jgi:DNA modification methylase